MRNEVNLPPVQSVRHVTGLYPRKAPPSPLLYFLFVDFCADNFAVLRYTRNERYSADDQGVLAVRSRLFPCTFLRFLCEN